MHALIVCSDVHSANQPQLLQEVLDFLIVGNNEVVQVIIFVVIIVILVASTDIFLLVVAVAMVALVAENEVVVIMLSHFTNGYTLYYLLANPTLNLFVGVKVNLMLHLSL